MEIEKIKWNKKTGCVDLKYKDDGNEYAVKLYTQPHPDFIDALRNLKVHMLDICEFEDGYHKYDVTGVSIGGYEEYKGAVIMGRKEVLNGKVLNLVTPFVVFDEDKSDYEDSSSLAADINDLLRETSLLIGGKSAQSTLEFPEAA